MDINVIEETINGVDKDGNEIQIKAVVLKLTNPKILNIIIVKILMSIYHIILWWITIKDLIKIINYYIILNNHNK